MAPQKKPSLATALQQATTSTAPQDDGVASRATPTKQPPSRRGKRMVSGYFDPAVQRQINQMALDANTSVQDLLREALNDLFAKHGKPRVA